MFNLLRSTITFKPHHNHTTTTNHNKWLTFMTILYCLLLSRADAGSGGRSSQPQSLTAIENETVGKVINKGGSGVTGVNRLTPGGVFDNIVGSSRSGGKPGGGGNSITSNELNHPHAFNAADDHDEDFGYDDEDDDDDSSYTYDSFENVNSTDDMDFIKEHDKLDEDDHQHHLEEPSVLGKCCRIGEGLNLRGGCDKIHEHHLFQNDKYWFPERVYHVESQKMMPNNISLWTIQESHRIECPPGERAEIIHDMKKFTIFNDGSLFVYDHERVIKPLDYCVDLELGKSQGRVIKACFSSKELCDDKQCLRKCCPKGSLSSEILDGQAKFRCERSPLSKIYYFNESNIVVSNPTCSEGTRLEIVDSYNISKNGTLETPTFSAPLLSYCLDYFLDKRKGVEHSAHSHANNVPVLTALICFDTNYEELDSKGLIVIPQSVAVVFGVIMIISAICLAIAAVISWRLPELRSLHGKCQLSHLITMFFLFLCLGIVQVGTQHIPQGLCTFFGVFIHICALSSFLWLNLLCVNIYLTFRSLRPPLAARRDENRRLLFLCIYAWGIPMSFCLFLYVLDAPPGSSVLSRLDPMPAPEYGHLKCLISNRGAEFAYLFGPVGVLLLCNGLLFCLTAQELLCGVWRLDNSDSINFRRKSMGIVVAKLGIVMGMGWILDVLSWAIGSKSYMFYAADLFNSFQGVLISIILLWRKRVLEVLHLRKPSITKDETLTARPFLPKNGSVNAVSNGDHDTSLVMQEH